MPYNDIPDHPVIQSCERTGYPNGTPRWPICPVCHDECSEVFVDWFGDIKGCDQCADSDCAEEGDICPVCGAQADTLYKTNKGAIIGCDHCMERKDAYESAAFND